MSAESTRAYLARYGLDEKIITYDVMTATVEQAAEASGLEPGQIGKTMAFDVDGDAVLVVCAGDAKVWNSAFKRQFHTKPTFIKPDELEERVGHPMGGVCPFDVRPGVRCDAIHGHHLAVHDGGARAGKPFPGMGGRLQGLARGVGPALRRRDALASRQAHAERRRRFSAETWRKQSGRIVCPNVNRRKTDVPCSQQHRERRHAGACWRMVVDKDYRTSGLATAA